jgi:hypothetical protein
MAGFRWVPFTAGFGSAAETVRVSWAWVVCAVALGTVRERSAAAGAELAGEDAGSGTPGSLLLAAEACDSGVGGVCTWCFSGWGGGRASGSGCETAPLCESSGVTGRAAGAARDRRCGMAGTMRGAGRRACFCDDFAESAETGAMAAAPREQRE